MLRVSVKKAQTTVVDEHRIKTEIAASHSQFVFVLKKDTLHALDVCPNIHDAISSRESVTLKGLMKIGGNHLWRKPSWPPRNAPHVTLTYEYRCKKISHVKYVTGAV